MEAASDSAPLLPNDQNCPKCSSPIQSYLIHLNLRFTMCSNNTCDYPLDEDSLDSFMSYFPSSYAERFPSLFKTLSKSKKKERRSVAGNLSTSHGKKDGDNTFTNNSDNTLQSKSADEFLEQLATLEGISSSPLLINTGEENLGDMSEHFTAMLSANGLDDKEIEKDPLFEKFYREHALQE